MAGRFVEADRFERQDWKDAGHEVEDESDEKSQRRRGLPGGGVEVEGVPEEVDGDGFGGRGGDLNGGKGAGRNR